MKNQFFLSPLILTAVLFCMTGEVSAQAPTKIFRVKASGLRIRDAADAQSQALGALPRGAYIASSGESYKAEKVDGVIGNWINIFPHSHTAYAFDAFLSEEKSARYIELQGCERKGNKFTCEGAAYLFESATPIAGGAHSAPKECAPSVAYFYDKTSARVAKLLKNGGAGLAAVVSQDNKILQFIAIPDPRGDCG